MASGKIKRLLIDLDGTLVNFREMATQAEFVSKTLRCLRRELPKVNWMTTLRGLRAIKSELKVPASYSKFPLATNAERSSLVFARVVGIPYEVADQVLNRTMAEVFPKLRRHFFPIPGANEFIQWAHSRVPITLATNPVWPIEIVKYRVEWGGIDPGLFSMITHSGLMSACKPSRTYYTQAVQLSEAGRDANPADCFHVGNELVNDLAATRVGIPVFIVSKDNRFKKIQAAKADLAPAWSGSFSDLRSFLEDRL